MERSLNTPRQRPARVFISYRHDDSAQARRLLSAAEAVHDLELHAFPDDLPSSADWRETCAELILGSDAVVCVVGPTTADSPNVEWELDEAKRRGLPVLLAGRGARALADSKGNGSAEIVEDATPEAILAHLEELVSHPEELV